MKKIISSSLIGMVLAGAVLGCSKTPDADPEPQIDPNAPIVKVESYEGYKEAKVVGRSYYPGWDIEKKERSSSSAGWDNSHSHNVTIKISQPERYFLFVKINNRTFVKEVDKEMFRDVKDKSTIMAKYIEKRKITYKPEAELEKMADDFNDLEILSLELKK